MDGKSIRELASAILDECTVLENVCQTEDIPLASLEIGESKAFWSGDSPQIGNARSKALGLLGRLTTLLQGPHEFLHEFVAPNWDHGALYAFLRSNTLDQIASSGENGASLKDLSKSSGIPSDKLVRILSLLRCKNIVRETQHQVFSLTALSEELVHDEDFRAWVEFQWAYLPHSLSMNWLTALFETRIASAHLSDALSIQPNGYRNGSTGFNQGFGMEMYDWHIKHAFEGDRFRRAMRGVSKSLDPADELLREWFQRSAASAPSQVVEIGGRYGFGSILLASEIPERSFEIKCDSKDFLDRGKALVPPEAQDRITFTHVTSVLDSLLSDDVAEPKVYLIRNMLWNWTDGTAVKLLQAMLPSLKAALSTRVLVTDGVSPLPNEFPPHVEIAYRRRDITTMTMHNVKQRTQAEWLNMFMRADPSLKIKTSFKASSHVYKGLWELSFDR